MVAIHAWFKNSGYTPYDSLDMAKTAVLSGYVESQKKIFTNRLKGELGDFYNSLVDENGRIGVGLDQEIAQVFNQMTGEFTTGGAKIAEGVDISYKASAARLQKYIGDGKDLSDVVERTQELLYSMVDQVAGVFDDVRKAQILTAAAEKKPINFSDVQDGLLPMYGADASIQQIINNYNKILTRVENLESYAAKAKAGQKTVTFKNSSGKGSRMAISKAEQKTIGLIGGLLSDTGGVVEEIAEVVALSNARSEGLSMISEVFSSGRAGITEVIEDSNMTEDKKKNDIPQIGKNDIGLTISDGLVSATIGLSVKVSTGYTNLKSHTIKIHDTSLQNLFNKASGMMPDLNNYARNLAAGFPDAMKTPTQNGYKGTDDLTNSWNLLKKSAALMYITDYLSGVGGEGNNSAILIYNRKPILISDILNELVTNPHAVTVEGLTRPTAVRKHIDLWSNKDRTGETRSSAINSYLTSEFAKTASVKIKLAALKGLSLT